MEKNVALSPTYCIDGLPTARQFSDNFGLDRMDKYLPELGANLTLTNGVRPFPKS
jgi:hypothetical protein